MPLQDNNIQGPEPPYDLTDARVVRRIEQIYHLHARKSFSQHWLTDRDTLMQIIDASCLTQNTTALEVGAGMGVLTTELARRAGRVVAVEIERDVWPVLRDMTSNYPHVELLNADLMKIDPARLFAGTPYTFVANLPYAITSHALRYYLESSQQPERMVVLIQYEVAERLIAQPGEMSMLALSVQMYGTPRIVARVPAYSFTPPPEVDSAIVALEMHPPLANTVVRERMFKIAKQAFAQRRKQLHNILPGALHLAPEQVQDWLASVGIAPDRRPQTLSLDEWIRLTEHDPRPWKANR
jgi:16S rRNA (adenine1518-N6/adenine1519-N6)-dimethyltransferase